MYSINHYWNYCLVATAILLQSCFSPAYTAKNKQLFEQGWNKIYLVSENNLTNQRIVQRLNHYTNNALPPIISPDAYSTYNNPTKPYALIIKTQLFKKDLSNYYTGNINNTQIAIRYAFEIKNSKGQLLYNYASSTLSFYQNSEDTYTRVTTEFGVTEELSQVVAEAIFNQVNLYLYNHAF